ncbi:MAG TPA: glycosyltransferase family 4 protein [Thermoplasmata archaeon]|nr:glycosyltransferase family 4 protein [Thermoplasmata archaeon]
MNRPTPTSPGGGPRVLELTQRFPPALGGVERHVEQLARELAAAGARVEVVTTDLMRDRPFARGAFGPSDASVTVRRHRAVRWVPVRHGLGIAAPGMLVDALRAPTDVLHAHAFGYFPTWAGRVAHDLRGVPLVITPHSDPGTGTGASLLYARAVRRATLRRADRIVALTHVEADALARDGVDERRIRVIPNGVDLDEFSARAPRPAGPEDPIVLFVGRLYPEQKGIETLVEAFASLARTRAARLRLVGEDWGGLAAAERIARERGIAGRLTATGPVPRAALLGEYARADLLVLPSRFEPFGIVLLEAMAAGLPVVASRVGGIPEVVADGRTGLLVPPGEPGPLAEAIGSLLDDPIRASRLGAAGRARAASFAWPRLAPQYLALFRELAPGTAVSAPA